MGNNNSTKDGFEKKSERLDIRVSHQKKQDFSKACENQGDTPSNAVRRFITTYIRRAKQDDFGAVMRKIPWRRTTIFSTAIIALAFGSLLLWGFVLQTKETRIANKVFSIYDDNKNGLLDIGEITPDDFHLHRVLNIDGQNGISRDEFTSKGTMIWHFVNPDNFKIVRNDNGHFKQTLEVVWEFHHKEASSGFPIKRLDKYNTKVVKFNLRNPDKLEFTVYEQKISGSVDRSMGFFKRSVTWVEGRKTPEIVMGLGRNKAVLTKDTETL